MCPCHDPAVFGHRIDCKKRPESWPSCGDACTTIACWDRCTAWRAQARVFGWVAPGDREAVEEAALS